MIAAEGQAMSRAEARARAIELGAVRRRGTSERIAERIGREDGRAWADGDIAQARLKRWTAAIMRGDADPAPTDG